ncbi:MAG: hypothetical protein ACJ76Y_11775 [Thermoanaerobaculia bacterium]
MFRRGKKVWRTAALALALLWAASPSWAASRPWRGEPAGWTGLWERALAWLGGPVAAPAHSSASAGGRRREKSSSSIDPLGQTVPASTTSDSSSQIDPNGRK